MAVIKSNLVTLSEQRLYSEAARDGDAVNGKLSIATARVTLPAASTGEITDGDTIMLIPERYLPPDAVIVTQLSSVTGPDPGDSLTLIIGYKGATNAIVPNLSLDNLPGGMHRFSDGELSPGFPAPVRTSQIEGGIFATINSLGDIVETPLTFIIAYRSK